MAVPDWRKREIAQVIDKGVDEARDYLEKLRNTVDGLYEKSPGDLGIRVKKLHDIISNFMNALPGNMNELWEEARELRERTVKVKPTAHRNRDFGFGSLSLEVEEETGYMIGEDQDGMSYSSRKLTEDEESIYFADDTTGPDKKLVITDADKEVEKEETEDTPKIYYPGFTYDEDGNLVEDE